MIVSDALLLPISITVLTVTRNAQATVARTIESFLKQTHPAKQMVILDGASSDNTVALAASFNSPLITIVSEPDSGMYDALNKGLSRFEGDAFGVLNADDNYAHAEVLSQIAERLAQFDMVHGDLYLVDPNQDRKKVRHWRGVERPKRGFKDGWMPAHPTFYVRRSVAETVGEFDLSLKTAADYDWMLRAVELNGFSLGRLEGALVEMDLGGRSTSSLSSYLNHNLEALKARQRWLGSGVIDLALFSKVTQKLSQFVVK